MSIMEDELHPKTLYVGNLDLSVTEDFLSALFGQIGEVKGCKIIREPGNDPYAFIEFTDYSAASTALTAMNKRVFLNKELKVNWATRPGNHPKTDTTNHYHIFVGDLSPEIDTQTLRDAFAPFGEISNCRIVRDQATLKSKGYAFVSFVKKAEAEAAIHAMNGQWLGSRSIRTNWSTRQPAPARPGQPGDTPTKKTKQATFDEIYNQSSPTNSTVYCGGFPGNYLTEELVYSTFSPFGNIQNVRIFRDKGYTFVKFVSKEDATRAIEQVHNAEVDGHTVKCFWGKESGGDSQNNANGSQPPAQQPQGGGNGPPPGQYPYNYQDQMNYWYSTMGYLGYNYQQQQYAAAFPGNAPGPGVMMGHPAMWPGQPGQPGQPGSSDSPAPYGDPKQSQYPAQ